MIDTPELEEISARALEIARGASRLLLEGHRRGPAVRSKGRSDLVTEYDERSELFVREGLARAFPSHTVVGEEMGGVAGELAWYVDPLDGTTNFAHGHPFFCLSLGLVGGGEHLVGVVVAPALGTEWTAHRGGGAWRDGSRIGVSDTTAIEDALLATGFPATRASVEDNNYRAFLALDAASHGVRRCGAAALELALVADGGYDAFWDLGLKPWDLAAGALLVREAGGRVTDLRGEALELSKGRILASNGRLHDALVAGLAGGLPLPPIALDGAASRSRDGLQASKEVG